MVCIPGCSDCADDSTFSVSSLELSFLVPVSLFDLPCAPVSPESCIKERVTDTSGSIPKYTVQDMYIKTP